MSYTDALKNLRMLLSDTERDKRATGKGLLGSVDGTNKIFYSYDKRILADTLKVFVDGQDAPFTLDDAVAGKITITDAPPVNAKVAADYYFQWWLDDQLKDFLNRGAQTCSAFDPSTPEVSYDQLIPGLRSAATYFACHDANMALIQLLVNRRHSEEFLTQQDGNDDANFSQMIEALRRGAKDFWERAIWSRDDYYERQGRRNKPSMAVKTVSVRPYGAKR